MSCIIVFIMYPVYFHWHVHDVGWFEICKISKCHKIYQLYNRIVWDDRFVECTFLILSISSCHKFSITCIIIVNYYNYYNCEHDCIREVKKNILFFCIIRIGLMISVSSGIWIEDFVQIKQVFLKPLILPILLIQKFANNRRKNQRN